MTPDWNEMAVVGTIARAHGIRGEVIVNPETDFPDRRFRPGARLFTRRAGADQAVLVVSSRIQRGRPVIGLEGVHTMNDAEELAGCELRVPAGELERLPEGSFYRHELVGCEVETGTGERVGVVREVDGAEAASRLVVDGPAGEVLIPLAAEICRAIDTGARRIVVSPPDGLLELNARRAARGPGAG